LIAQGHTEVPKILGTLAACPLGWEHGWPLRKMPLAICYRAILGPFRKAVWAYVRRSGNVPIASHLSRSLEVIGTK